MSLTNKQILTCPTHLLRALDKQKRFILQEHSKQKPCPNCALPLNVFEAMGVDIDDYPIDGRSADERFHCPRCKRELQHILPAFVATGWFWYLKPIVIEEPAT